MIEKYGKSKEENGHMNNYLEGNNSYWQQGYYAPNVESYVFRMWGHVLKYEFPNIGTPHPQKMLDFGCGQGAALSFYYNLGFDVYGVDISKVDIDVCKRRMSDISDHFIVIESEPNENDVWFDGNYDLVTAYQSLYYYNDYDLNNRLKSMYSQMKPGAFFCATMMGTKNGYYEHSSPFSGGMRSVSFKNSRLDVDDYYVNFIDSKEELINKFSIFEKMHTGFYDSCFREDEGCHFHWTYIGRKGK